MESFEELFMKCENKFFPVKEVYSYKLGNEKYNISNDKYLKLR